MPVRKMNKNLTFVTASSGPSVKFKKTAPMKLNMKDPTVKGLRTKVTMPAYQKSKNG